MNNNFILNLAFYDKMKVNNNNINKRIKNKFLFHIIILTKNLKMENDYI